MATADVETPATVKARAAERHREMRAKMEEQSATIQLKCQETEAMVELVTKHEQHKASSLARVENALNIDVKARQKLARRARSRSLVTLGFCFVILGCELDFLGFVGAFPDYWSGGRQIVRILLVTMPSAFLLCVAVFLYQSQDETAKQQSNADIEKGSAASDLYKKTRALVTRQQVQLTWYHFLPLARYILLIKSIEKNDIEGVFRVNSLSSFTLGSCQTMGLVFAVMDNGNSLSGLSLFIYMNMVSQLVNWTITILYFTTSISKNMQNAISVDAYKHNLSAQMRTGLLELQVRICEDAEAVATKAAMESGENQKAQDGPIMRIGSALSVASSDPGWQNTRVPIMRKKLEVEIEQLTQCVVDLKYFEPIEILQLRRAVYLQVADEFDN